jgi:hypothetical protein
MSQEHKNIFNEVTSLQELNAEKGVKMPKSKDDFTNEDKVETSMDFWKFKEEKEVIGVFSRWETDNYGEHAVLMIEKDDKEEELHLPNLMALNGRLKSGKIAEGKKVKIVYTGQAKAKSGRLYEDFDVFIK